MTEDGSESFRYSGLDINHRTNKDAPNLLALSADANELTEWAEVPRANPNFMNGYQRQLEDNRIDDISDFFKENENIIPGAILVTVDEEYLEIDGEGDNIHIKINTPDYETPKELVERAFSELYSRLSERGKEFVDGKSGSSSEDGRNIDQERESPISYLAQKTSELKDVIENFDDLDNTRREPILEYARRMNKPGKIIDGQHRVFGGKQFPEKINYPVILIPGLEAREQVYQFYIINDKAEPISTGELLITVSTALSEKESDKLFMKLLQSGVDVKKARDPYIADVDNQSPFHNMVNYEEKVGDTTGSIDYRYLFKLMDRFIEMKAGHRILYENIEEWDSNTQYRINRFYVFWQAIKEHYPELWEDAKKAREGEKFEDQAPEQFFQKDAMQVLQDYILDRLSDKQRSREEVLSELDEVEKSLADELAVDILTDDEKLKKEIKNILDDLPEEFFRKEWEPTGLSTGENRENFREEIEKAVDTTARGLPKLRIFNQGF